MVEHLTFLSHLAAKVPEALNSIPSSGAGRRCRSTKQSNTTAGQAFAIALLWFNVGNLVQFADRRSSTTVHVGRLSRPDLTLLSLMKPTGSHPQLLRQQTTLDGAGAVVGLGVFDLLLCNVLAHSPLRSVPLSPSLAKKSLGDREQGSANAAARGDREPLSPVQVTGTSSVCSQIVQFQAGGRANAQVLSTHVYTRERGSTWVTLVFLLLI